MTEIRKSELWIMMKHAHERIGRNRSTVYKWVAAGRIRTMRPRKELWLFLPDLLAAENQSVRRVKVDNGETV